MARGYQPLGGGGGGGSNPMTALGDMIIGGSGGSEQRLPGNVEDNYKFLSSKGNGVTAELPEYILGTPEIEAFALLLRNANGMASLHNLGLPVDQVEADQTTPIQMDVESSAVQFITGVENQAFALPDATTLPLYTNYVFANSSDDLNCIAGISNYDFADSVAVAPPKSIAFVYLVDNSTEEGVWVASVVSSSSLATQTETDAGFSTSLAVGVAQMKIYNSKNKFLPTIWGVPQRNYVAGGAWTAQTSAADNGWYSVCWSPKLGLFCAVAITGTGNRVMTSPDGVTWTARTSAADNQWLSVCWSPELGLFCAVANSGTGNRVMTSPDGINWTVRTTADNSWRSLCWSPELGLFCAVANTGTNRVMTSPDGINWTERTAAIGNQWYSVCWSPELGLFCSVAVSGTGNRVMTSPDGINWTSRISATDNQWRSVCWSPKLGLFCAVANSGTGNRVMTSPDGINWTARTSAADNQWDSVCWSPELGLFCAVANSGTGNRIMTSPDGVTWTARTSAADNQWLSLCWSPELGLFCAVANSGTGNRVMTSSSAWNLIYA